jgi:non-ribosomal peptide synthetase-like protein
MVADGLSIINADFSSTSFRVSRTTIGPHNFLGNSIAYPSQGKTGANCLLATKVLVPIDGKVRENVGLLGSPSFEIPRTVERDSSLDHSITRSELRRRLSAKNRHNIVTMGWYLLVRWLFFFSVIIIAAIAAEFFASLGASAIVLANLLILLFGVVYWVLVDRIVTRFIPVRPLFCSIYQRDFWRHERFWKVPARGFVQLFDGTPFKNVIWRLLDVRLGRRVFDDGLWMTERTLVTIGDDCTFNAGSGIQCHSQEDGAFKSDNTTIGSGCTLGVGAFVHYGVTIGDGVILAPDSFLMKGEEIPPHAYWGGNPARELQIPAWLGGTPPHQTRIPAALGAAPAEQTRVQAALGGNGVRKMPVAAALGAKPLGEMPVPAALVANSAREMPGLAALKVRQDRDESPSIALARLSSPCPW